MTEDDTSSCPLTCTCMHKHMHLAYTWDVHPTHGTYIHTYIHPPLLGKKQTTEKDVIQTCDQETLHFNDTEWSFLAPPRLPWSFNFKDWGYSTGLYQFLLWDWLIGFPWKCYPPASAGITSLVYSECLK